MTINELPMARPAVPAVVNVMTKVRDASNEVHRTDRRTIKGRQKVPMLMAKKALIGGVSFLLLVIRYLSIRTQWAIRHAKNVNIR